MPFDDEIPPHGDLLPVPDEINALSHRVIGIAIEIHRELGPGLPEEAYEKALAIEFRARGISYVEQHRVVVEYKGQPVCTVRLDFLIEPKLVLEVKSVERLTPVDRRQVIRYLEVKKLPLGLLINFNVMVLKVGIQRVIRSSPID